MTHQMPLLHPSTQWNTEKMQRFFRFDVASDAKCFWRILVVESPEFISMATPAEPRGEKLFYFCKFWAVKNF